MSTIPQIHGHDVLHLLLEANPPLTRPQLAEEATRLWGPDARFHTCSAFDMTLNELLAFLVARGKIADVRGTLVADITKICGHGHDHDH